MRVDVRVRRFLVASAYSCAACILGCTGASNTSEHDAQTRADEPSRATGTVVVEDLEGRPLDPLSASAGRVVVLTFVRTDCPIANRYAPTVRKLGQEFAPQGVDFYLVYPNPAATAAMIRRHLKEYDWQIAALRDPEHALVDLADATVTPESAVFDRAGRLVYHGRIDDRFVDFAKTRPAPTTHDLRDAIAAALAEVPVSAAETEAVGCFIADLK